MMSAVQKKSIVLVHGGFVDGSGWAAVYAILKSDGYNVIVVQNPTIDLAGDVAVTKRAIDAAGGDVILVGHSYGGVVITEAGNDANVKGLVYITAFAPDTGESVSALLGNPAAHGAPPPPLLPPQDGFLMLDPALFPAAFAADVEPQAANFMANAQVPWGVEALSAAVTEPAWKSKRSWYLLVTSDKMIVPPLQRFMAERAHATIAETPGSHAIYVSKPEAVARLIEQAAAEPGTAAH
jgi:pimeloyl-ACP methyl ester carboxylesterase